MREGTKNNNSNKKKIRVSLFIDSPLWIEFDQVIEKEFGKYKKSLVIEHLIRNHMKEKNKNDNKENWI